MRQHFQLPPRGRSDQWLFALGVALVLGIQPIWPDRTAAGVAGVIALTLIASARWQLRWLPVVVLVTCAVVLRTSMMLAPQASDVSDVTTAAITKALAGENPYGIGYYVSRPVGAPFPYGPVALLWYLPSAMAPRLIELVVSIALIVYFGVRAGNGRPMGLAIFALAPPLVLAAVDGSNDTSAGLLILAALAIGAKRPIVGAAVLAFAVSFKPYAIAWLIPLVAWAGVWTAVAFLAASVVAWAPVLFVWGIDSYLKSLAMAQVVHMRQAYWSLAAVLDSISPDLAPRALETMRYFLSGAVAILGSRRIRSIDGVILVGTVVFVIAQFGGYFGSYVYLAAVAPILCWRIDDWLHRGLPEVARAYADAHGISLRVTRPTRAPTT